MPPPAEIERTVAWASGPARTTSITSLLSPRRGTQAPQFSRSDGDDNVISGYLDSTRRSRFQPHLRFIHLPRSTRFVHDELEMAGWGVDVADAVKVKGLAPLACKTDKIDARVLTELCRRDLVPAIWLPTPDHRGERERSRWRLHLVRHRVALKNRIHATLLAFGHQCPTSDLFGVHGRRRLAEMHLPEPWLGTVEASLRLIDEIEAEIANCERDLRALGAQHAYIPKLMTVPGIGWVLAYTIASEIGDINRFASPKKLCGYTGLCPRVYQSGTKDHRGTLRKNGPAYLRWALIEAATHAELHPAFHDHYEATKKRLGKQRGAKVARVDVARRLAEAMWHMLTRDQAFSPAGPPVGLVA